MQTETVIVRASSARLVVRNRLAISLLAICVGLPLSGCGTGSPTITGTRTTVSSRDVVEGIEIAARTDRTKQQRAEDRRKASEKELTRDIDKIVNCYSGDVGRLKALGAKVHRFEAGALAASGLTETAETFRREYGTGGGGGGGGGGGC